jgi:hypothetical protein
MRFKGIRLGLLKGKGEKDEAEEAQAVEEAGQTGGGESPETATGQSPEASELSPDEEIPIKPHGPLVELSLDSAGDLDDMELNEEVNDSITTEEDGEPVKLVELKTEAEELAEEDSIGLDTDTLAPEEEPEEEKPKPADDSFDSLFANDEEEENPKASLIESLPDVSAQEILNDISELKEIMREGH